MNKHKAKIGDKIIITCQYANASSDGYIQGDIYNVIGLYDETHIDSELIGVEIDKYNKNGTIWVNEYEYEVYRGVNFK